MKSYATLLAAGTVALGVSALGIQGAALAATPKDTVVIAYAIDDIISLDPGESFEFSGSEAITNMYQRLIAYDPKDVTRLYGQLAETWYVGGDGKTYTFKLRKGVKFHSGNVLTAADAAYSLQRAVILNKSPGFILTQFGFNKDNVKQRIRAVDDSTLVVETAEAVAPTFFYYCMTAVVGGVVDSKEAMKHEKAGDFGNGWLKSEASAGTGPYKLVNWKPKDSFTMIRHEDHWSGDKAKTRRVVVRHIAEPAAQRLLLEKGDIDFARNLGKDDLAAVARNKDIKIQQARKGAVLYISFSQKNPNLAKPEVREALKYLIDYDAIEKNIVQGTYVVHQNFLPQGFLGAISDRPYKLDVAKAKDLLTKAGLPNGFNVTMDTRNNSPTTEIAQAIQGTFAQAGVKLEIIPGDGRQTLTKYRARNHDIYIGRWGPDYQDPHTNAETFAMNEDNGDDAKSKTLAWRNSWNIPQMTAQIKAAVREVDPKKRVAIYEAAQREFLKTSPFAIMFQQIETVAHRANVDGFEMGPSFEDNVYYGIVKK
ncbi:MAG: ABC transporter substrate-binding protein [Alphaproteobacteria bacterium]|nr:ABC transporter substrate-binding protein [Alphaproteobacteria bacterium]